MSAKEIPYDENHPHYFFRETYGKWIKYNGTWYTPEEWEAFHNMHCITPKVEWYFDILQVMKEAEKVIVRDPSPEKLERYFAMVDRILDYYHHKMVVHGTRPHMGR